MKIGIVGSRDFKDKKVFMEALEEFLVENGMTLADIELITSDGAEGTGDMVSDLCRDLDIDSMVYFYNEGKYGEKAAAVRSQMILASVEGMLVFWNGKSKETEVFIDTAKRFGKKLKVIMV